MNEGREKVGAIGSRDLSQDDVTGTVLSRGGRFLTSRRTTRQIKIKEKFPLDHPSRPSVARTTSNEEAATLEPAGSTPLAGTERTTTPRS